MNLTNEQEHFFVPRVHGLAMRAAGQAQPGPQGPLLHSHSFYPLREVGISKVAIAVNSDISATCLLGLYCSVNSHGRIYNLHSSPASSSGRVCTAIDQFAIQKHNYTCASEMAPRPFTKLRSTSTFSSNFRHRFNWDSNLRPPYYKESVLTTRPPSLFLPCFCLLYLSS